MSGPKNAYLVPPEPVTAATALVAAAAIHAAAAVVEGYEEAARLERERAGMRDAERAALLAADTAGLAAMEESVAAADARFARLMALAAQLGVEERVKASRPGRPQAVNAATLAAYVRALEALNDQLQSILLVQAGLAKEDRVDELRELVVPAALAARPTTAQRLLARIGHLGAPPAAIATLAADLEKALPGERADLLASELRRQVQAHLEATQKQMLQRATGVIVEQSLKDLGYQVEEVAETLFVESGVVHFRRKDWGDYQVRMRIDGTGSNVNFNVVRAVDAGANERSVMDHIAEDRWCAEFPAMLKALEARGVRLQVTRHLKAGEVPVQLVERGKLPAFTEEEAGRRRAAKLKAREIR